MADFILLTILGAFRAKLIVIFFPTIKININDLLIISVAFLKN